MRETTFFQPKKNAKKESEQHEQVMGFLEESDHFFSSIEKLFKGIQANLGSNTTIKQDDKKQANFDFIYKNVQEAKTQTTRLCANRTMSQETTTNKQDELTGSFKKT